MGEIKFTAEKASSTAKLKVKGKHLLCAEMSQQFTKHCCMCFLTVMLQRLHVVANGLFLFIMAKSVGIMQILSVCKD